MTETKPLIDRLRAEDLLQQDEEFVLVPLCREAADEIDRLRAALSKYGDHKIGCPAYRSRQTGVVEGKWVGPFLSIFTKECACGLDEAKNL